MYRHRPHALINGSLLLGSLLAAPLLQALPSDREQPVQVSADSARFNEKTGIASYTGNVHIQQGSLQIHADKVVVTVDSKGSILSTVSTGSPARYQQQPDAKKGLVNAEALRIDYDAKNAVITLTGNARLQQDGSRFSGQSIVYNSQKQQVDARGDGTNRVQLVFPPQARELAPKKDKKK